MTTSDIRGRFLWYELMTRDTEAARAFYTKVVGWGTQAWDGGAKYTLWTNAEGPVGGLVDLADDPAAQGAPPMWMAYVGTPDVDATIERAIGLKAELLMGPMDMPNVGRFAVLKDPQGAVFAPYNPATPAGPEPTTPTPAGGFTWHELVTTDQAAAFAFYSALFGWTKADAMDMGPGGVYQMYGRGGMPLGGMFNKTPEMQAPPMWLYYVLVPDLDAAMAAVREGGGRVLMGPTEVPGGDMVAQCMDPQGAAFALHARKAASAT